MKRCCILLVLILNEILCFGQSDGISTFNSHKFPCDSGSTTLEINICSAEKLEYADSLLNVIYRKILRSLDKNLAETKRDIQSEQSKKDTSAESKAQIEFLIKESVNIQRFRKSIVTSQQQWIKLRDSDSKVVRITCEGGTACNAIVNDAVLQQTLERIKSLESWYDLGD